MTEHPVGADEALDAVLRAIHAFGAAGQDYGYNSDPDRRDEVVRAWDRTWGEAVSALDAYAEAVRRPLLTALEEVLERLGDKWDFPKARAAINDARSSQPASDGQAQ